MSSFELSCLLKENSGMAIFFRLDLMPLYPGKNESGTDEKLQLHPKCISSPTYIRKITPMWSELYNSVWGSPGVPWKYQTHRNTARVPDHFRQATPRPNSRESYQWRSPEHPDPQERTQGVGKIPKFQSRKWQLPGGGVRGVPVLYCHWLYCTVYIPNHHIYS